MTAFFVDTSALGKRYILETGTEWLSNLIHPDSGNLVIISELALVEIFSVFARKQRENKLSTEALAQAQYNFLWHVKSEYQVIFIDSPILGRARELVSKHPLRTLDAIQLACAVEALTVLREPIAFISADKNLLAIAAAEGFATNDPNAHA